MFKKFMFPFKFLCFGCLFVIINKGSSAKYTSAVGSLPEKINATNWLRNLGRACPAHCLGEFRDTLENEHAKEFPNGFKNTIDSVFDELYSIQRLNKTKLVHFCSRQIYRPFLRCMKSCHYSVEKTEIEKAMQPTTFLCQKVYFIRQYFDCYVNVKRNLVPCCEKLHCRNQLANLNSINNAISSIYNGNNDEKSSYTSTSSPIDIESTVLQLKAQCSLMQCSLPCEHEILTKTCHEKIAKAMTKDYVKLTLASSKSMFLQANLGSSWPEECDWNEVIANVNSSRVYDWST